MDRPLLGDPQRGDPAFSWACGKGREGGGVVAGAWVASGPKASVAWGLQGASGAGDKDGMDAGDAGAEAGEGRRGHSQGAGSAATGVFGKGKEVVKGCGLRGRNTGHSRDPQTEEGRGCGRHSNPA